MLADDPSIMFDVIEKNPEKFMSVVKKASVNAQQAAAEREMEENFTNPLQPLIDPSRAVRGKADAPITIVEFTDFQCPYCERGFQTMEEVHKNYGDKIRFVIKHFPLSFHAMALPAAKYFEAIALQDPAKAYKFHDQIFLDQRKLSEQKEAFLIKIAKNVGADMARLKKDLESDAVKQRIEADQAEAKKFGVNGTPGFLVNGIKLKGAVPYEDFAAVINRLLGSCPVPSPTDKR